MSINEVFIRNLKARRRELKIGQIALACRSGYSKSYICEVENMKKTNPTLGFVETMAVALQCSVADLLKE